MQPKKSKLLLQLVAERVNMPEDLVTAIVTTFFTEVKSALSTLKYPVVQVSGLGNFAIKPWVLDKYISRLEARKYSKEEQGVSWESVAKESTKRLQEMNTVKALMVEERARKQAKRLTRKNDYEPNRNSSEDLEREGKDC